MKKLQLPSSYAALSPGAWPEYSGMHGIFLWLTVAAKKAEEESSRQAGCFSAAHYPDTGRQ